MINRGLHRLIEKLIAYSAQFAIKETFETYRSKHLNEKLLNKIPSKGNSICLDGPITISHPKNITLGSNITIKSNCHFETSGGLSIKDNCIIKERVTICTSASNPETSTTDASKPSSVAIGNHVVIESNVIVYPGVSIGNNTLIKMGAIVTESVGHNQIIEPGKTTSIKCHSIPNSDTLPPHKSLKALTSPEANIFFCVGTGRSGTKSIAESLSNHSSITCSHEPKGELIRLSTDFEHGVVSREFVKKRLSEIYSCKNISSEIYGESDQKLSNLISILNEIQPCSKFIWIIRNPKDTVRSTFSRGWFSDNELLLDSRDQLNAINPIVGTRHADARINGHKCGQFSYNEWKALTPFERNCWYWAYWNSKIMDQLDQLNENRWIAIKLEELDNYHEKLSKFLRLNPDSTELIPSHSNRSKQKFTYTYIDSEKLALEKFCKPTEERIDKFIETKTSSN